MPSTAGRRADSTSVLSFSFASPACCYFYRCERILSLRTHDYGLRKFNSGLSRKGERGTLAERYADFSSPERTVIAKRSINRSAVARL